MQQKIPSCLRPLVPGDTSTSRPRSRWRIGLQVLLTSLFIQLGVSFASAAAGTAVPDVIKTDCVEITCPTNIVLYTCERTASIRSYPFDVRYTCPNVPPSLLNVTFECDPPPGAFAVGVHKVNCEVRVNQKPVGKCTFTITVIQDTEAPKLECPQDLLILACQNVAGACGTIVNYAPPVASDNSGVVAVTCNPPSGSFFTCGTHTVVCTAFDRCQNATRCEFKIVVREAPPVRIVCPTNPIVVTLPCDTNCAPVTYPAPSVINGTLVKCEPPSGTCLPVGDHVVFCVAKDECGRTATCEFVVHVRPGQAEPPIIRCPQPIVVTTCDPCERVTYPAPVVVNGALAFCDPPSGSCFKPGVNIVTCVATNGCAKEVCRFTVTVLERPAVQIRCPQDIVVETCDDCAIVRYPDPIVANGRLMECDPPSGSCFKPGVTIVRCVATNECGRTECKFTVTVRGGGSKPEIRCPQDIVVETCRDCEVVQYPTPVVVNGTLAFCNPPSGSCFKPGTTIVTCVASNSCGRTECKFTVTVKERPRLGIRCPEDIVVETCGEGQVVHFPAPTVLGATDPSDYTLKCDPPSGSFFPVGTHKVVCCVIDRCERRTCCEFTIVVRPGTPCMTPPGNMVLWTPFDEPAGVVAFNAVNGAPSGLHINGPTPVLGQKVFNSLDFDGANDYVAVPNYAAIMLSQSDLSIDAWLLRRDTGGRRTIVSKMGTVPGAVNPQGYEFYLNQGIMHLTLAGAVTTDFNSGVLVPADNQWHHVVTTVRRSGGGLVRFFLDGVQVNVQAAAIPAPLGNNSRLHIGASTYPLPQNHFAGAIDEVEIFSRPLTLAEVTGLYAADRAGKCKVKCIIPWDVSFPTNGAYVTVMAKICNCSVLPQTVGWMATGPMEIPAPNSGVVFLPPNTCTNIPIKLCRPTNNVPVGSVVEWNLTVFPRRGCPTVCKGSVINPGPITTTVPEDVVQIPGTRRTVNVPVNLGGLPDGAQVRVRAIAPGMEPDTQNISLNGLPPGTPWIVNGNGPAPAAFDLSFNIPIRFVQSDPMGLYTILIETDVDGDKDFDTLRSFDIENPVIPPPSLSLVQDQKGLVLSWNDEGDGLLESAHEPTGPWTQIPDARPGYRVEPADKRLFFRVSVPYVAPEVKPSAQ